MSDNPTAESSQVEQPAAPQVGNPQQQTAPVVDLSKLEALPESWQKEIKALRKENASYRATSKERADAEQTEAQTLRASLDELTPRYADLESKYNTLRAQIALRQAGADDEAADLLAAKLDPAVLDDPDKLAKAIDKLRQERPRLFRVASLDGGARGSTTPDVGTGLDRIRYAIANSEPRRR